MDKIELLAPAGSIESIYAAVNMGADAVYLGGSKFSARAYAANFKEEDMIKVVNYCHIYNVKVYVTVNTLLKDKEIIEAVEYVGFLYKIGVDAVIIQDTGLAYLIKNNFPNMEIHASTQMTVHNGEGALLLKDLGYKRIVLSRELTLKEIEYISKDLNIETEIFIHGALCICYSGQCLMSSLIGGRSGNRGRCAQPCRLPYTLINKENGNNRNGYLLSPKDTCVLRNIEDIIKSGTASLKIEGRMKRPEYVAGVVDVYRRAIDSVYGGKNFDYDKEEKLLMQLFNREGFSKAYMFGNVGSSMMSYNNPKNTGLLLGNVKSDNSIILKENIGINDGIRTGDDGFKISKIIKDNKEVEVAYTGDKVKLKPSKYNKGSELYKTSDDKLLNALSKAYENPYEKKNFLNLKVKFKLGEVFTLTTEYNKTTFTVKGDIVAKALKRPMDREKICQNLKKTGNTAFEFNYIEFEIFEEGFLPVSNINAVRRELIEKIEKSICKEAKEIEYKNINLNREEKNGDYELPKFMVAVIKKEQIKAALDNGIQDVIVDIFKKNSDIDICKIKECDLYLKVPNIIKEEFEIICSKIEEYLPYIKGIVTSNAGIINRFKRRIRIIGDYKSNIFNKYSLDYYKDIIDATAISVELNKKEISTLSKNSPMPIQMLVYGKIELMVSEHCPVGSIEGNKNKDNGCNGACEKGSYVLKDRKGEEFVIITDKYCRSHIYNSKALNLSQYIKEIKGQRINSIRLDFIDEDYEETFKVIQSFEGRKGQEFEGNKYTKGHYKRGVE